MSTLQPLLDVQELDLASDGLIERRRTLPERAALVENRDQAAALDVAHASLEEQRATLRRGERELGGEVGAVAAKAKEVEDQLYSGSVTAPKELEALQEEIRLMRQRQAGIEEQEMELLEQLEQAEGEIAANRDARAKRGEASSALEAAIAAAEGEIDGELADTSVKRGALAPSVPAPILEMYERLRGKERLRGRAAAELRDGSCRGCRVKLPVMEYARLKAEPEDALLCCVHCGRVLVR